MDKALQDNLQKLGALLAASPMDEQIKEAILGRAEELTPALVEKLISSLEREQAEFTDLEALFQQHDTELETDLAALETEVQSIVDKAVGDFVAKTIGENSDKS